MGSGGTSSPFLCLLGLSALVRAPCGRKGSPILPLELPAGVSKGPALAGRTRRWPLTTAALRRVWSSPEPVSELSLPPAPHLLSLHLTEVQPVRIRPWEP